MPILVLFAPGVRHEVRFTILKAIVLFCGICGLAQVATVTVARYACLSTSKGSKFPELSIEVNIMFVQLSVYKL